MMRGTKVMGSVLLFAGIILGGAAYAVTAAPAGDITIEGKKPAMFSHSIHQEVGISCGECHHDANHEKLTAEAIGATADGSALKCASCHNGDFANVELQKLKKVFHNNCRECHKAGFNGKTGPTKCNDCHLETKKKALEGC